MTLTRDGKFAYVVGYDSSLVFALSINPVTGALSQVGAALAPAGMVNPSGPSSARAGTTNGM